MGEGIGRVVEETVEIEAQSEQDRTARRGKLGTKDKEESHYQVEMGDSSEGGSGWELGLLWSIPRVSCSPHLGFFPVGLTGSSLREASASVPLSKPHGLFAFKRR